MFFFSEKCLAQMDLDAGSPESKIMINYQSILVDKVTNDLLANYKIYLESPNEYWNFLRETFLTNWDFDATTRALIGIEVFNTLTSSEFIELSRALEITLIRYAFESLSFYDEQKLNVIDIRVNEQYSFAWLKISMDSPRLPDIHLDLLLKRSIDNQWRGVDFRFKGITYTDLKKNTYRQDFKKLSLQGLVSKLVNKNKAFFRELCQAKANYLDPKNPPCLQNYDKK